MTMTCVLGVATPKPKRASRLLIDQHAPQHAATVHQKIM